MLPSPCLILALCSLILLYVPLTLPYPPLSSLILALSSLILALSLPNPCLILPFPPSVHQAITMFTAKEGVPVETQDGRRCGKKYEYLMVDHALVKVLDLLLAVYRPTPS